MPLYHQVIRLSPETYRGHRAYFITICTHRRFPVFLSQPEAHQILAHLQTCAASNNFRLHAFCVMPDHVHFLTEGAADDSHLIRFTNAFKQTTGFDYRQRHTGVLWQKRFYDYILRQRDAIEDVAAYIWMNPVRKTLCANPLEYPFSGSQTIEWMMCVNRHAQWMPPWRNGAPG
jgi:putative transposase